MADGDSYRRTREFLVHEAELLDDRRLDDWLDLLTDDLDYVAPQRVVREKGSEEREFKEDTFYFYDDKVSIEKRVEKLLIDESWGENPPSRTRRMVGNIRIEDEYDGTVDVKNNFLMYHNQGMPQRENVLSGERHDTLTEVDGDLKLSNRRIYLDVADVNFGLTVFL